MLSLSWFGRRHSPMQLLLPQNYGLEATFQAARSFPTLGILLGKLDANVVVVPCKILPAAGELNGLDCFLPDCVAAPTCMSRLPP